MHYFLYQRNNLGKNGFSLIELMIVVAIMGILAAIAVPQFKAFRVRSFNANAKALSRKILNSQADLNAEIAVFGHTENKTTAYNLSKNIQSNQGSGVEISSADYPKFVMAATAKKEGGRIAGINLDTGKEFAVPIGFGKSMSVYVNDEVKSSSCITGGCSFVIVAKSDGGDTSYGLDSNLPGSLYSVSNPSWPGHSGLDCNPSTLSVNQNVAFANQSGNGSPTKNWTLYE